MFFIEVNTAKGYKYLITRMGIIYFRIRKIFQNNNVFELFSSLKDSSFNKKLFSKGASRLISHKREIDVYK